MISEDKMEEFNAYALDKVYFYIESGFWSKPSRIELENWFSNFNSIKEKYCALKLLDRFVYYSEDDIFRLIRYGINEKIFKRYVLDFEKKSDFSQPNEKILDIKKSFLESAYFVPLNTGNLSQSSLVMARHLTISIGISQDKILDTNNLETEILKSCKNLIILDDFVGSGKQISDFWSFTKARLDGREIMFNELKTKFPEIEIEYFCLVCTSEGYDNFKLDFDIGKRSDLKLTYSELLGNKFKIFGEDSIYFNSNEIEYCKDILQNVCENKGLDFLGYQSLDYAISFHHSIPDCSLPLFFMNTSNWNYLFRNKKTESDV
jgi:hypothetical protein